jgi:hypothetical protein
MTKAIAMIFCALPLFFSGEAAAAPTQLYGKSVIISYTGTNNSRPAGSNEPFRPHSFSKQISVYISSAGRPFMRNSSTAERAGSASLDQVGASGTNQAGGASSVQFQGSSLVVVFAYEGGAAQIRADFDPSFTSCTANVIRGIATGRNTRITKGLVTGNVREVESSSSSSVSCSLRDGNVFAQ